MAPQNIVRKNLWAIYIARFLFVEREDFTFQLHTQSLVVGGSKDGFAFYFNTDIVVDVDTDFKISDISTEFKSADSLFTTRPIGFAYLSSQEKQHW